MKRERILIVEDEPIVALGIQASLRKLGYQMAGTAETAEKAVRSAREFVPDLVLMDIHLRGGADGVAAAEEIRRDPGIPVVFLTAYSDDQTLQRATSVSPYGYVLKPFQDRELHLAIEMALLRSRMDRRLSDVLAEVDYQRGFFEALFETNPSGILVVDAERRVYAANQALGRMLGVATEELAGKRVGEFLQCTRSSVPKGCGDDPECDGCLLMGAVTSALRGGKAYRNRAPLEWLASGRVQRSDFLVSGQGINYRKQRLAMVILEDVTELNSLRKAAPRGETFAGMVGRHRKMTEVFDAIRDVAASDVPVLVLGESGTGKELVARAIHDGSRRSVKAFVPVNCGALPENLLESELFGHVRGSFTGAIRDKKGRFELADGGTIFLDEIGDLSPLMQVKLLRVLQEGMFERVGAEKTLRVDVRLISATHKDLRAEVAAGRFREDLYYRLCVVPIMLPPLREREGDIRLLAREFLKTYGEKFGEGGDYSLQPDALRVLEAHPWPGNVRELQNVLQFAIIKAHGQSIGVRHLPPTLVGSGAVSQNEVSHSRLSAERVQEALRETGGNRVLAARRLGVSRATLYRFFSQSKG